MIEQTRQTPRTRTDTAPAPEAEAASIDVEAAKEIGAATRSDAWSAVTRRHELAGLDGGDASLPDGLRVLLPVRPPLPGRLVFAAPVIVMAVSAFLLSVSRHVFVGDLAELVAVLIVTVGVVCVPFASMLAWPGPRPACTTPPQPALTGHLLPDRASLLALEAFILRRKGQVWTNLPLCRQLLDSWRVTHRAERERLGQVESELVAALDIAQEAAGLPVPGLDAAAMQRVLLRCRTMADQLDQAGAMLDDVAARLDTAPPPTSDGPEGVSWRLDLQPVLSGLPELLAQARAIAVPGMAAAAR